MHWIKTISSTDARQSFSSVLSSAKTAPITILKKNKWIAVILSTGRYNELTKLEDLLFGKAAEMAIKEWFVSQEKSENLLDSI